jgi:hypothetical protein
MDRDTKMHAVTPRDVLDNCYRCLHPVNPSSKAVIHTALLKQRNPTIAAAHRPNPGGNLRPGADAQQ